MLNYKFSLGSIKFIRIKKAIKNLIQKRKSLFYFFIDKNIILIKIMNNHVKYKTLKKPILQLLKNNYPYEKILTGKSLLSLIIKSKKPKHTCHILGSGLTCLSSVADIDSKNEYVMGLSYSNLYYSKPDIIFLEAANERTKINRIRSRIISKSINHGDDIPVIWKNLYMTDTEISKETINKYFKCNNYFLIDYGLIPFNKNNISTYNYCLKNFINSKYDIGIPQYQNSIVTLIGIASKIFKRIIIHGCDMGGDWFYDSEKFLPPKYLSEEELNILREKDPAIKYNKTHRETKHAINAHIGLRLIMPQYKKFLREKGIEIIFARDSNYHPNLLNN